MDEWLGAGGWVVAASDRAARAAAAEFHRARQAEGLTAWAAPRIVDWNRFVRGEWEERGRSGRGAGRLVLNAAQERALWTEILRRSAHLATVLEGPRHRLAGMAAEAHGLLCAFAPRFVERPGARSGWQADAGALSGWLAEFDEECRKQSLVSAGRLAMELVPLLKADGAERPGLMLALDRGGACRGIAFRIRAADLREELLLVWRREMLGGAYLARWVKLRTQDGPVRAVTFVVNRAFPRYAPALTEAEVAERIATAQGELGSCAEYFEQTVEHLHALGLRDAGLERIRRDMERRAAPMSAAGRLG